MRKVVGVRICAWEPCGAEFQITDGRSRQRYCGRSCAGYGNNKRKQMKGDEYAAERAAAIQTAINACQDLVDLRPLDVGRSHEYIHSVGRVPTAKYLETLYAGRRYDD